MKERKKNEHRFEGSSVLQKSNCTSYGEPTALELYRLHQKTSTRDILHSTALTYYQKLTLQHNVHLLSTVCNKLVHGQKDLQCRKPSSHLTTGFPKTPHLVIYRQHKSLIYLQVPYLNHVVKPNSQRHLCHLLVVFNVNACIKRD